MSLFFQLDGVDMGTAPIRLGWGDGLSSRAEMGAIATSNIPFDDAAGTLTTSGLSTFFVRETESAGETMLWAGFLGDRTIERGDTSRLTGAARLQTPLLVDLNNRLQIRVIRGAKRPAETVNARLAWLLASTWLFYVRDNGEVGSSTAMLSATDYRGQYASNVLSDCAEISGYNFFVYWDSSAGPGLGLSLYFQPPSYTGFSSTLRFTNVLADVDNSTTFAAQGSLSRTPEDVYSGVYVVYSGGSALVSRQSIVDDFYVRQTTVEKANITDRTHALAWGNRFLDDHDQEVDTLTITTVLPKEKVNLILAGHRVQFKFSHLPGYTSYVYSRVSLRTVAQDKETPDYYTVTLEIKDVRTTSTPGGPASDNTRVWPSDLTPFVPVSDLTTLTSVAGNPSTAHVTVNVGDWVYINELSRTAGGPFNAQILYRWGTTTTSGPYRVFVGVPQNGTTVFDWLTPIDPPPSGVLYPEVGSGPNGVWRGYAFFLANNVTYSPGTPYDAIGPGGAWQCTQAWIDAGPNPGATSFDLYIQSDSWQGSIPYSVSATFGVSGTAPEAFDFGETGSQPATGQPVYETETPDGATSSFTAAFSYAPGSLTVFVDGILQDVTETSPSAGTWALYWTPATGDEIKVRYRAA